MSLTTYKYPRRQSSSAENVSVMGAQQRGLMPPPDILSDISRRDKYDQMSDISRHDKYDQMSDVICQLSDVLGQRQKTATPAPTQSVSETSGVRRTESEEDAETMTDVQSCLDYIDGLLATPEMINIPERRAYKVNITMVISTKHSNNSLILAIIILS